MPDREPDGSTHLNGPQHAPSSIELTKSADGSRSQDERRRERQKGGRRHVAALDRLGLLMEAGEDASAPAAKSKPLNSKQRPRRRPAPIESLAARRPHTRTRGARLLAGSTDRERPRDA